MEIINSLDTINNLYTVSSVLTPWSRVLEKLTSFQLVYKYTFNINLFFVVVCYGHVEI